jgi:hypothetical protein
MTATIDEGRLEQFLGAMIGHMTGGALCFGVWLGDELGLYRALADIGPSTPQALAEKTSTNARLVREWLDAQAAGRIVDYDPATGLYGLSAEAAAILADDSSAVFVARGMNAFASMFLDHDKIAQAFRGAGALPWGEHNPCLFCGVAAFYRNAYRGSLVQEWLPALDGVTEKLRRGARVADVGCGHGHSTVLMAQAFPNSQFWGFDGHQDSVDTARGVAAAAGVADRVTCERADAAAYPKRDYDLICFFDCLHDMGRPVDAASHAATALAKDGTVMLIEPFAGDRVEDNIGPVGRLY